MISVILRSSFFVLATLHSIWDFSLLAMDRTQAPALQVRSLKHGTTREILGLCFNLAFYLFCSKMKNMKLFQSKINLIGV